jgi:hypothetical protein
MKVKETKYINPVYGREHGEFTWCPCCERVYKTKRWDKNEWACPTEKCAGDEFKAFPWSPDHWPMKLNPSYPRIPIEGKRYLLNEER